MPEYAKVMLKGVYEHVDTNHALYVQWDGMANDKSKWDNIYQSFDYIGAPWPWQPDGLNVGNGGFSLRSRRLLEVCASDSRINLTSDTPIAEDNVIGINNRQYLETKYNIQFADTNSAKKFSYELGEFRDSFGFHGLWNVFRMLDDQGLDYFLHRINYSGWNIYKWHHVLVAAIERNRRDIYDHLLDQLTQKNPDMLSPLVEWLDREGKLSTRSGIF
jgi:hypothetical protein